MEREVPSSGPVAVRAFGALVANPGGDARVRAALDGPGFLDTHRVRDELAEDPADEKGVDAELPCRRLGALEHGGLLRAVAQGHTRLAFGGG